jgi:hypothetical protein
MSISENCVELKKKFHKQLEEDITHRAKMNRVQDGNDIEKDLKSYMYALTDQKKFNAANLVKEGFQNLMGRRHKITELEKENAYKTRLLYELVPKKVMDDYLKKNMFKKEQDDE